MKKIIIKQITTSFLIVVFSCVVMAQVSTSGGTPEKSEKNFSFMPVPYISYDRTLGFSAGLLPMAMYNLNKKDTLSPQSLSAGFGMYTSNKSWFLMQLNRLHFNEDKYRVNIAMATGKFNSQFYLSLPFFNDFIDYSTAANFFKLEIQRQIVPKFYGGLNYIYVKFLTDPDLFEPGEIDISEEVHLNGIGAILSYDVRDNIYYPLKGIFSNLNFKSFPDFMGNDHVSNKIILDINKFFGMNNQHDVIGVRLFTGAGIGDLSFNQKFVVGNNDIRGYTQGKYRGDQIVTIQGEYRWNPMEKLGFVGFAGVASIFSGINEADNGKILPAIGTGFRYNVFPKNHMNVGMECAVGVDDWGIYFRIGEAF